MTGYHHSDTLVSLGKAKMQDFHQEQEAVNLAKEARNFQPGRIGTALNHSVSLFKLLVVKLEKRFGFGRNLRHKILLLLRHKFIVRSAANQRLFGGRG